MRSTDICIQRSWDILTAFCRWFLRIIINAHQQFAYWRSRITKSGRRFSLDGSQHNLQAVSTTTTSANAKLSQEKYSTTNDSERHIWNCKLNKKQHTTCDSECELSGQLESGSKVYFKTPRFYRRKLTSIFRRISLHNLMDYCVAALNEASNSSCSNKFDLNLCNEPVWLLGRRYDMPEQGDQLIDDIKSKLWITYRRNFPPIDENTRYTTDRGFGCMIRCGQMVLANALLCKNLTREWRWLPGNLNANPRVYSKILKLFQDREDCPYSIHRIVQTGQQHEGKNIGEWFGPNTIAQALKKLSSSYLQPGSLSDVETIISIEAALDNVVIIDEIKSRFKKRKKEEQIARGESNLNGTAGGENNDGKEIWIPGILFIQLRLGLTKINPLYFAALKKTFRFKNSLGIIGGRPNHALYMVGFTGDEVIYLDPHSTQQYVDFDETTATETNNATTIPASDGQQQAYTQFEELSAQTANGVSTNLGYQLSPDETYHCLCPEKMSIDRLDPSLALCFYFGSESEFDEWCNQSEELLVKSEQAPMFEITKSRPRDWGSSVVVNSTTTTQASPGNRNSNHNNKSSSLSSDHDEEFEILT